MLEKIAFWLAGLGVAKTATHHKNRFIELADLADAGYGWPEVSSGAVVNTDTALGVTDVLACARVIAEGVAQMPLRVMKDRADGGKDAAVKEPEYKILHRRPNEWQTSFEFRETLTIHAVLTGNAFAFKTYFNGKLQELIPIMPNNVTVERLANYELRYHVSDGAGKVGIFTSAQIFHLRGPSWDAVRGLDIVHRAREAIGLAISVQESQGKQHANGIKSPGFVAFEGALKSDVVERIRESWQKAYAGTNNAGKVPFLDNKAVWHSMAQSNTDAQVLETRGFQTEQICRAFGVFPQMIGHSDKTSTYASAEQFFLAHVIHTLGPWIRRWEQTLDNSLFNDRRELYSHFTVAGLLRGDAKARGEFYKLGVINGWFNRNEIRLWEDLNPEEGLEKFLVPQNMAYADGTPVVESATVPSIGAPGNET